VERGVVKMKYSIIKSYGELSIREILKDWKYSTGSFDRDHEELSQYEVLINNLMRRK